jgi:acyl carrier protein
MSVQTPQERELAELIVECLNLEDVKPEEIEPEEPLFGDGLGLDSIDALEMALAISQKYGVQLRSEDEHVKETFSTLRTLNQFILDNSPAASA